MSNLYAIILAAGKGTRMKSEQPKVLHEIAGLPMLQYVLEAVKPTGADLLTVVGHGAAQVEAALAGQCRFALQEVQLGTGHGVMCALPQIEAETGTALVLCGDTPQLRPETVLDLLSYHREQAAACTVLTARMAEPKGYGRIVRDGEKILRIVEERDADDVEKAITEINSGVYCFALAPLRQALSRLKNDNDQGEYYLTDVLAAFVADGLPVAGRVIAAAAEIAGVNDRRQLAEAEKALGRRKKEELMLSGVTLVDPDSLWVAMDAVIGADTVIEPQTVIRKGVSIGKDAVIGPMTEIAASEIGDGSRIRHSVLNGVRMGKDCNIGPYAYLRPGTVLADRVKVGDFVELKKTVVGEGSKVPHHSYVGDTAIGRGVNVGCGTITCNYDGFNKYETVIEDGAFIGSNTSLVAPVTVGRGAIVAAGSVITADVPAEALAVARGRQENRAGWAKRFKEWKTRQ